MKIIIFLLFIIINTTLCENTEYKEFCDGPNVPQWKNNNDKYFTRIMDHEIYAHLDEHIVIPCCVYKYLLKNISWYYQEKNSKPVLIDDSNKMDFTVSKYDKRFLELKELSFSDHCNITSIICEIFTVDGERINYTTEFKTMYGSVQVPVKQSPPNTEIQPDGKCIIEIGKRNVEKWCTMFFKYTSEYEYWTKKRYPIWYFLKENKFTPVENSPIINVTIYENKFRLAVGSLVRFEYIPSEFENTELQCITASNLKENKSSNVFCEIKYEEINIYQELIIYITPALLIIIIFSIIFRFFHLEIKLYIKDKFYPLETLDGLKWDVYICYAEDNRELTGNIGQHLKEHGYKCYVWEIIEKVGKFLPSVFQQNLKKSRRFLILLSEELLEDNLSLQICEVAVARALSSHLRIIAIIPHNFKKQLKQNISKKSEIINTILSTCKKIKIPNPESFTAREQIRFYRQLLLVMPPIRNIPKCNNMNANNTTESVLV